MDDDPQSYYIIIYIMFYYVILSLINYSIVLCIFKI